MVKTKDLWTKVFDEATDFAGYSSDISSDDPDFLLKVRRLRGGDVKISDLNYAKCATFFAPGELSFPELELILPVTPDFPITEVQGGWNVPRQMRWLHWAARKILSLSAAQRPVWISPDKRHVLGLTPQGHSFISVTAHPVTTEKIMCYMRGAALAPTNLIKDISPVSEADWTPVLRKIFMLINSPKSLNFHGRTEN